MVGVRCDRSEDCVVVSVVEDLKMSVWMLNEQYAGRNLVVKRPVLCRSRVLGGRQGGGSVQSPAILYVCRPIQD